MHVLASLLYCYGLGKAYAHFQGDSTQDILQHERVASKDWLPLETRAHWMRRANQALHDIVSPCPFEAFGSVIVNHTAADGLGDLICIGANAIITGNPTLHGEVAAINNCSAVLTDPRGRFRLSASEATAAFHDLTLYTNAEPCPMCATAIRWAGFRECVFGTATTTLTALGWPQVMVPSEELFRRSTQLNPQTNLVQRVLGNETDAYFSWQFDPIGLCPQGCERKESSGNCEPVK